MTPAKYWPRFFALYSTRYWVLVLCLGAAGPAFAEPSPATLSYRILEEASHDRHLFTQGLLVDGEHLIETSGGYGQSLIRRYRADSGKLAGQTPLPRQVFAEGVAKVGEHFWVLTWREGAAFKLKNDLTIESTRSYTGEGWGLTFDGEQLVMSDGSDLLTMRNPETFEKTGSRTVYRVAQDGDKPTPQGNLNELEFAQGLIWANIWQDSHIVAIDPDSGQVKGILDLADLVKDNNHQPGHSVLNGIAYDPARDAFWVTGKLWPRRYLIAVQWPGNSAPGGNRKELE